MGWGRTWPLAVPLAGLPEQYPLLEDLAQQVLQMVDLRVKTWVEARMPVQALVR